MKTRKGRMLCFLSGLAVVCLSGFVACDQFKYRLNEQSAQDSMKALRSAEKRFASNKIDGKFGTLKELAADGLIDSQLATGMKDGYRFSLLLSGASYKVTAVPVTYDKSGSWSFYVDESGVIRGTAANRPATVEDRPVRYQE